ncbi:MAG: DHH family phosphoesterase [Desulfurococcales archaeon]|nr:DHH family phosphoesterase [Desulfurococcales archaeon]
MKDIVDLISGKLKEDNRSRICIVTHKNADPDAVASSLTAYYIVNNLCSKCRLTLCYPEGIAAYSHKILERYAKCSGSHISSISTSECSEVDQNPDIVITVDTANPEQLGCFSEILRHSKYVITVDHHKTGELKLQSNLYVGGEKYSSTSEIMALILEAFLKGKNRDDNILPCLATMLMSGIVYDSRRFLNITSKTFKVMEILRVFGGNYFEALNLLEKEEDRSQRIAILKACQRIILREICGFIVVGTHIGSFESNVARVLVNNGADIAIVLSDKKDATRIALRSRDNTVDISAFASWLAGKLGTGSGGGHFNSALFEGVLKGFERSRDKKVKKFLDLFGEFCNERSS